MLCLNNLHLHLGKIYTYLLFSTTCIEPFRVIYHIVYHILYRIILYCIWIFFLARPTLGSNPGSATDPVFICAYNFVYDRYILVELDFFLR